MYIHTPIKCCATLSSPIYSKRVTFGNDYKDITILQSFTSDSIVEDTTSQTGDEGVVPIIPECVGGRRGGGVGVWETGVDLWSGSRASH